MQGSNSRTLEVLSYRAGDEEAILDCMTECFESQPTVESWQHLHLHNPAGKSSIVIARDNGRVVSHVAVVPRHMRVFGQEILGGGRLDSMTRPDYRRRGLQVTLDMKSRELIKERNLLLTYRFSNSKSLGGAVKNQGYLPVSSMPVMVRPVRPFSTAARYLQSQAKRRKNTRLGLRLDLNDPRDCASAGPILIETDWSPSAHNPAGNWRPPDFDESHTDLYNNSVGLPQISMVRSARHLRWRYSSYPGSLYLKREIRKGEELMTMAIIRIANLFGFPLLCLMEWHWCKDARDAAEELLREIVQVAASMKMYGVTALAMHGTLQARILAKHGFLFVPKKLLQKSVTLAVRSEDPQLETTVLTNPSDWYLTWGDGFIL